MTTITETETGRIEKIKKETGRKVFGYYCCYLPVELLTAAGILGYRIMGDPKNQITESDAVLESVMCPWVRNTFDQALKGKYSFLDGMIGPHVCDAVQRMYSFWKYYLKLPYNYYLDIPHIFSKSSFGFFALELEAFKKNLEEYTGKKITDEALRAAIELHNENRKLVQELYSLRKAQPPLIAGSEVMKLLKKGLTGMPVEQFNGLLRKTISDARTQPATKESELPRLLLSGCVVDDEALFKVIEDSGAHVVMDDTAIGTRSFWFQVKPGQDIMASLSHAYLESVRCPRTIVGERTKYYKDEFKDRWGYLLDYAREYRAAGAILYLLHYCDCHEYDFIDLKDYLADSGVPTLVLDDDYTTGSIQRVKTRVEAFIETLNRE